MSTKPRNSSRRCEMKTIDGATILQPPNEPEQPLGLQRASASRSAHRGNSKRGSPDRHRAGELDELRLADGEAEHGLTRVEPRVERVEQGLRALVPSDGAPPSRAASSG